MTILQSKSNQQGDSDDPPPKKKLKKSKSLIRRETQPHAVNHPTTSSAPGPSHRRSEQRDLYSYLASSSSYFTPPEPESSHVFGQGDRVVHHLQLDKFDVGLAPRSSTATSPFPFPDFDAAGPSQVKTHILNPDCLEYYIYGPGWRSPHAKAARGATKRPLPDVNLIEVISSEDIVGESSPRDSGPPQSSEGGSLLDDINNFDVEDKFGELEKIQQEAIWEDSKMHNVEKSLDAVPLMNGFDKLGPAENVPFGSRVLKTSPAAALSNLGNTCFLNSVLYTLRYAPDFAHNLHHLVTDMNVHTASDLQPKKTASLGRNLGLSSLTKKKDKDLSSGAGDLSGTAKTKKQIVTEKLHGVYESMRAAETKELSEPVHPESFLTALREVNPIFEGNQQQDAHELLVCLLDIFRETCQASARQAEIRAALEANAHSSNLNGDSDKHFFKKITKTFLKRETRKAIQEQQKNEKNAALNTFGKDVLDLGNQRVIGQSGVDTTPVCRPLVDNFVAQDFEGVMVLRTTCLQCENTTEKNEPFADICVPIKTDHNEDEDEAPDPNQPMNPSEMYQRAVVTDEYLRDRNKYYCEECMRYNEARRSVRYQTLPRLLTLQLKRFSSTYGAMSKVTKYMPTPMSLACFCEECRSHKDRSTKHRYELYGVIMHLGPNMAGGHYITYVRMCDSTQNHRGCARDAHRPPEVVKQPNSSFFKSSGQHDSLSLPSLPPRASCRSLDCCVPRDPDPDIHDLGKYGPGIPWMACDDESVKVLSAADVEALLTNSSTSNATPYLLFYARRTEMCTYG